MAATAEGEAADVASDDEDSVDFCGMLECEKDLKDYNNNEASFSSPTAHQPTSQEDIWACAPPPLHCHSVQQVPAEEPHDPGPEDEPRGPTNEQMMDKSDWQILPRHFHCYNTMYGPYTLDACADKLGMNAMVSTYRTSKEDCCMMD